MDEFDNIDTANKFIVKDELGTFKFLGVEDPKNPLVQKPPQCDHSDCSHMECPICHLYFDYLVGDDLGDGRRGCEGCWKPISRKGGQ